MIPIDRLRYAVTALVETATGATAIWARTEWPRSPSTGANVIAVHAARGPSLRETERYSTDAPTSLLWTVAAPVADTRIGIMLAGIQVHADLPGAVDATIARDALLAALELSPRLLPGVTVAAVSTDSIRISGAIGTLYDPDVFGSGCTLTTETTEHAQIVTGRAHAMLELEAFASGSAPTAQQLLGDVALALRGFDIDAIEEATGCTIARHFAGDVVDLTQQAGDTWQSRASQRLAVHLRGYRAVGIETITAATWATA